MLPDPVPFLRKGVGDTPEEGGCILQVVDWIHRHEWTDSPPCVHPLLRPLAIKANDCVGDGERQRLLDLVPRLTGTATADPLLAAVLVRFCAQQMRPILDATHDSVGHRCAKKAAWRARDEYETVGWAGFYAAEAAEFAGLCGCPVPTPYELLVATLDEYDRLTGRPDAGWSDGLREGLMELVQAGVPTR